VRNFQDTKKRTPVYHGWRKVVYSWPAIVVVGLLVVFLGRATLRVYLGWDRLRLERNQTEAKYLELVRRQEALKIQVEKLKTQRGWEEEIRRNFQVAKPGEGVIILVGTSTN